jgi:hypothetical protein
MFRKNSNLYRLLLCQLQGDIKRLFLVRRRGSVAFATFRYCIEWYLVFNLSVIRRICEHIRSAPFLYLVFKLFTRFSLLIDDLDNWQSFLNGTKVYLPKSINLQELFVQVLLRIEEKLMPKQLIKFI